MLCFGIFLPPLTYPWVLFWAFLAFESKIAASLNCTIFIILSHYVFAWIWYQYIYLIWIVLLFRMWNSISFDLLHLDNLEHCWNSILIFSHWILSIVSMYTEKLYIYWVEIFFFNSGLKKNFTRDFYDLEIIIFINII